MFLLKSNAELSGLSEHGEICAVDQPSEKCLAVNDLWSSTCLGGIGYLYFTGETEKHSFEMFAQTLGGSQTPTFFSIIPKNNCQIIVG